MPAVPKPAAWRFTSAKAAPSPISSIAPAAIAIAPPANTIRLDSGFKDKSTANSPHHFLITFTVPEQLRPFIRKNQRAAYSALFKTSSEAIKKLAPDEHYIGANLPGFFGLLHTWGRTLQYHPHIHYIVPGGDRRSVLNRCPLASLQNRLLSLRQSPRQNL